MKSSRPRFTELSASLRISLINAEPVHADRRYVLYWMIATRRPSFNFALDRSIAWALALGKPIVILEAVRVDYPWASDRLHRFVIDGMRANHASFADAPVLHYPYVERTRHEGHGLLERLAQDSAVIVTDDYPCFFLPLMPLAATDRAYTAASISGATFRRRCAPTFWTRRRPGRFRELHCPGPCACRGMSPADGLRLPAACCPAMTALYERCRSITRCLCAPHAAASSRRAERSARSLRSVSIAITSRTITPTTAAPAGSRHTCISAISRHMRSFTRS